MSPPRLYGEVVTHDRQFDGGSSARLSVAGVSVMPMRAGLFTAARPGGRIDRPDAGADAVGQPVQLGLADIGTPLFDATFVVVDLETTGGSARESAITEIGAVKVRGGETIGELQTLANPGVGIPPSITLLTGSTHAMVLTAPRISAVLPSFLEFLGDAVLVAHNARFDVGFLRAAAAQLDLTWPRPPKSTRLNSTHVAISSAVSRFHNNAHSADPTPPPARP